MNKETFKIPEIGEIAIFVELPELCPNRTITDDDIFLNDYNTAISEQTMIEKNGIIIYRHAGYSKDNEESLERQLSLIIDK